MNTTTRSLLERLAEDLREKGLITVTYRDKSSQTVAQYTDFVGNCAFFGLEGISSPRLAIHQHEGMTKPDLDIPLKNILAVEVNWHECNPCRDGQRAWWFAPFGGELQRFTTQQTS